MPASFLPATRSRPLTGGSTPREASRIEQVAYALTQGYAVFATGQTSICLAIPGRAMYRLGGAQVFGRGVVKSARSRTVPTGETFAIVEIGRFVVHSETLDFEIEAPQPAAPALNILRQKRGPTMNDTRILISIDGKDPSWVGTPRLGAVTIFLGDLIDFGVQEDALFTVKKRTVHLRPEPFDAILEVVVEMSPKLTREQRQSVCRYSPPFQPPPGFTEI